MGTFVKPRLAEQTKTLPGEWYCSPDVFARERERIFARSWCCVAREERVPNAGDYALADVAGESLIVARGADLKVRAFYNVCRHRGTRLCGDGEGRFNGSIQCPYHAWTYGLDGALLAARNMQDVPGFQRERYPLHQASVATRGGFIFVNLAAAPAPFQQIGSVLERFSRWNMAGLRTAREITYEVACNWKLVFQNYSECYHCPLVHPQLDKLSPSDSGRNDLDEGAILGGFSELRHAGTSLTTTGTSARPPVGDVCGEDVDRIYYYTVFPSMLLSLHADYVMVHFIEPLGVDRTRIVCAWLFDPATMARTEFDPSDAVDFWDLTNRQDWNVSERTQLGVASRAYEPGPYSNQEGLLAAFDRHYLGCMT